MEYKILYNMSSGVLQSWVEDALQDGWELQGGVAVDDKGALYQVIIKKTPAKTTRAGAGGSVKKKQTRKKSNTNSG